MCMEKSRIWTIDNLDVNDMTLMIHRFIQNTDLKKVAQTQIEKLRDATICLGKAIGLVEKEINNETT